MIKQHVFISYCRDNLSEVARLREDLIQAGEPVWWDQDGILPGQDWELAIEQAIENCYAFIACLSKETQSRFQTGIYPELDKAIEFYRNYPPGQVFIIPVRLSECQIPPLKISATTRLNNLHYVDLFPPAQRQAGLQKLFKSLQAAPERPPSAEGTPLMGRLSNVPALPDYFLGLTEGGLNILNLESNNMSSSFDVFLSHNSKDKPMVRQLAKALQARGLQVWLDEEELAPGQPWQEILEEIIQTAHTAAVLVGKDGLGPWEIPEMRACLSEFVNRHLPVIPVLLPDAPVKPELPLFLRAFTWVDLRGGLTEANLNRLQWGITGVKPGQSSRSAENRLHPSRLETPSPNAWKNFGRYLLATLRSLLPLISIFIFALMIIIILLIVGNEPPFDVPYPYVFIDIDDETLTSWGDPYLTPRDKLLCLINFARASQAKLVIVDIILSEEGESHEAADALKRLLPSPNTDAPCTLVSGGVDVASASRVPIILVREIVKRNLPGIDHQLKLSFLDEAVAQSDSLYWGSIIIPRDGDDVVRNWKLWTAVCRRDTVEIIPSVALVARSLLASGNPDEIVEKLKTCTPKTCDSEPDLTCGKIKIGDQWLDLSQQEVPIQYSIPWLDKIGQQAPMINWQGKSVPTLTIIPARLITKQYCEPGVNSAPFGGCNRGPLVDNPATLTKPAKTESNIYKDQIVIIGRSGQRSNDLHRTPKHMQMPGAIVLINTINTLLQKKDQSQSWLTVFGL